MRSQGEGGFTLIELLVVIAILSILFGIVAVVAPNVLLKAKITDVRSDFRAIGTALATYLADNGSYPPAFGYLRRGSRPGDPIPQRFYMDPYLTLIGYAEAEDLYDRFSMTYDTDQSGQMELFEFLPLFGDGPWFAPRPMTPEEMTQRPYVYAPVNLRQFDLVNKYYYENGTDDLDRMNARVFDMTNPRLQRLQFPAPTYDAYVLISVGPTEDAGGVATPRPLGLGPAFNDFLYQIDGLRVYWLATRDANDNGDLDFDYESRTKGVDGKAASYPNPNLYQLPNGSRGQGPLIEKQGG